MARSDFAFVSFFEDFNSTNTVATRPFQIEGEPFGPAYPLIQQFDVEVSTHRIQINGQDLPGMDMSTFPAGDPDRIRVSWMDRIPADLLTTGGTRITIGRSTQSDEVFRVNNVVIHWRERD